MSYRPILAAFLLILGVFSAAQEIQAQAGTVPGAESPSVAASGYRIVRVIYDIKGQTREYPLTQAVPVDTVRVFSGREQLDLYLADLEVQVRNQRVFESASVDWETGEPDGNAVVPVTVTIHTVDTLNIIALPYPKFDSNSGFTLKLKIKDFNFFGSMQVMNGDVNYQLDNDMQSKFAGNLDFSIPFKALGHSWKLSTDASVVVPVGEVPEFHFGTGLDFAVPFDFATLHLGHDFELALNDRNGDDVLYADDRAYLNDTFYVNLPLEIGNLGYLGKVYWTPSLNLSVNWAPGGITSDELKGPDLSFAHSVSMGRIDWVSNFRHGLSASASNSYSLDLNTMDGVGVSVSAGAQGYYSFFDRLGLTGQLSGFYNFNDSLSDTAGEKMRGILNDRLQSDCAVTLNLDMPVRVMRADFVEITGVSWTKYISFEMHASPFVDVTLAHDAQRGSWFSTDDGWYSGGLEIIVYPLKMRSIYARASAGFDLAELADNGFSLGSAAKRDGESTKELFVGIGLHY